MEQLLEISTVPIKIDITVNKAKFAPMEKKTSDKPEAVSGIKAKPVKSESESRALFEQSARRKDVFVQSNDEGIKISYQAMAKISSKAEMLTSTDISSEELAQKQSIRSIDRIMSEVAGSAKGKSNMSWSNGTLNLNFTSDQLGIDFEELDTVGFEFTPGSIDIKIEQMPSVNIEYVGDPIYVPRSADPKYRDLDIKA